MSASRRVPIVHPDLDQSTASWTEFVIEDIEAIILHTGVPPAAGAPAKQLADDLNDIASRFLRQTGGPPQTPPGARAEWCQRVSRRCLDVIEEFDQSIEEIHHHSFSNPIMVLLGSDQDKPFPRPSSDPREQTYIAELFAKANKFMAQTIEQKAIDRRLGGSLSASELLSISSQGLTKPFLPQEEVLRITLNGLAYLACRAELAEYGYKALRRQPNRLPPDRLFLIGLTTTYKRAFARVPGLSTTSGRKSTGGPLLRFTVVVIERLYEKLDGGANDAAKYPQAQAHLKRWINRPTALTEQLRDVLAINIDKRTFRRRRTTAT